MFDWVLNMLVQYILQNALDVYQLEVLANCLLKLLNRFHHNHCARSEIHVTSCSTYLLNDKNFNTCFITIWFYKPCLFYLIYFMLILNSSGIKYRVGNCHLLQLKILIYSLLCCCLMSRRPLRGSVWFYRIYTLINGSPRLSPWNAVVQNVEYQTGYCKIRFTTWPLKQPKR